MENAETFKMFKRGMVIVPPEGKDYGFPKVLERDLFTCRELKDWIVQKGYPMKILSFYGEAFLRYTEVIYATAAVETTAEETSLDCLKAQYEVLKARLEEYEKKEKAAEIERLNKIVAGAEDAALLLHLLGRFNCKTRVERLIEEFNKLRNTDLR
jgi:hypothetical protein